MTLQSRVQISLALMLLAQAVQAQPAEGQEAGASANSRAAAEATAPTLLELLEFLGEFTTEDGDWVDPALLEAGSGPARSRRPAERQPAGGADAGRAEEPQSAANAKCNARPCE